MGIGGAVLYSLALMAVHALVRGGAFVAHSLRWLGRVYLDGAALHGANVVGVHMFPDPLLGRLHEWNKRRPEHDSATGD